MKKYFVFLFILFPVHAFALGSLAIAGLSFIGQGSLGIIGSGSTVLNSLAVSTGLHMVVADIQFQPITAASVSKVFAPPVNKNNVSMTVTLPSGGSAMVSLAPVSKVDKALSDSRQRNKITSLSYYQTVVNGSLTKKFPDLQGIRDAYGSDLVVNPTFGECPTAYTQSGANTCTFDMFGNVPKYVVDVPGKFKVNPESKDMANGVTSLAGAGNGNVSAVLSTDKRMLSAVYDGKMTNVITNSDGSFTVINTLELPGYYATVVYEVNKLGQIYNQTMLVTYRGIYDLWHKIDPDEVGPELVQPTYSVNGSLFSSNANNDAIPSFSVDPNVALGTSGTNTFPGGTGSTGGTGGTGGTGTGTGTGTGNASGVATGGCGLSDSAACKIDDSGFQGKDQAIKAASASGVSGVDKTVKDLLDLVTSKTSSDEGMNMSWFPSLLPGSPVACRSMVISTNISRGDINLIGSSSIDFCDKIVFVREVMHWLFYVATVFAVFRVFVNSNRAAI